MVGAPVLLEHPSSLEHDTGAHPERAERIVAVAAELERRDWLGWERRLSVPATRAQLAAVHDPSYLSFIEETCLRGGGYLDADTVVVYESFQAALHAAGGAIGVVDALLGDGAPSAFSLHRPPGHHATRNQSMGFCLFDNVAVAARHALEAHGLRRVLILDWDVHHGNGTNDIFHASPEVLFVSVHQSPLYPMSGAASDVGSGPGEGYTVNLPVPPGSGDAVFCGLVDGIAAELIECFRPELVLISAGYDAHRDDPLAGCRVTEAGFAAMTASLLAACRRVQAPLGAVLEGGYDLGALARSVAVTLEVLGGGKSQDTGRADDDPRAAEHLEAAASRVRRYWPSLGTGSAA